MDTKERGFPFGQILFLLGAVVLLLVLLLGRPVHINRFVVFQSDYTGNQEIYSYNTLTGDTQNLTNSQLNECCAQWSPDGERILYHVIDYPVNGIYVMNADGSNSQKLTPKGATDFVGVWSPDSQQIAFETLREDGSQAIYVMNADGGNRHALTQEQDYQAVPAWSPDGKWIVYAAFRDRSDDLLVVASVEDGQTWGLAVLNGGPAWPLWSPDGTQIVFTRYDNDTLNNIIYSVNVANQQVYQITPNDMNSAPLGWMPDGKHLLFTSISPNTTLALPDAYVIDLNGEGLRRWREGNQLVNQVSFSPDGNLISYAATGRGETNSKIYVMNADGSDLRRITPYSANNALVPW